MMLSFFIDDISGKKIMIEAEESASVADLKLIIEEKTGILVAAQRLIIRGQQLEDGRTLFDYNITKNNAHGLHMVHRSSQNTLISKGELEHENTSLKASFFMEIMAHPATKIFAGLLILAGVTAITLGLFGIASVIMVPGIVPTVIGSGLLIAGLFASKNKPQEPAIDSLNQSLLSASSTPSF